MKRLAILGALLAVACSVPEPERRAPPREEARAQAPALVPVSVSGPLTKEGRFWIKQSIAGDADHHVTRLIGAIQPVLPLDAGPGIRDMTMQIREAHLRALPDGGSIIGGLPADAPPGTEPAPIRIDDCVIDSRIVIGPNVRVEESVIRVPHAETYDGGLPLFPHAAPAP